ncbi:MAG: FkbM family methyltransferase [Chloroflexota bacterium]
MTGHLQQNLGLRSLLIYYGNSYASNAWSGFTVNSLNPARFDIGAHVGNRLRPWLRLGARVVALEPQPQLMPVLRRLYGRSDNVTLLQEAVGATQGTATLLASPTNPTVATLSPDWIEAVQQDPSFASINWEPADTVSAPH